MTKKPLLRVWTLLPQSMAMWFSSWCGGTQEDEDPHPLGTEGWEAH